ncbi:hypothetical protein [Virgibacillus doumboii]|uniref:hypothetical protein n=1 Tax=Virgibacillus doumboii TaxID=2697503 RepID=UPI0013DEB980|nr:hypothetical protein [Virgibacillus doumboii]
MSMESEDFLYELQKHFKQTHILKDAYERLSPSEKEMVKKQLPPNQPLPLDHYQQVYEWYKNMQQLLNVTDIS